MDPNARGKRRCREPLTDAVRAVTSGSRPRAPATTPSTTATPVTDHARNDSGASPA